MCHSPSLVKEAGTGGHLALGPPVYQGSIAWSFELVIGVRGITATHRGTHNLGGGRPWYQRSSLVPTRQGLSWYSLARDMQASPSISSVTPES